MVWGECKKNLKYYQIPQYRNIDGISLYLWCPHFMGEDCLRKRCLKKLLGGSDREKRYKG